MELEPAPGLTAHCRRQLTQNAGVLDELLAMGQLRLLPNRLGGREGQIWLVDGDSGRAVLRRLDPGFAGAALIEQDRRWQHRFLSRLALTGFPAPVPIGAFDDASVVIARDGAVWELLSFINGVEVGWSADPGMEQIGALLAHFHDATQDIPAPDQRPTAVSLAMVPGILRRPTGVATQELREWCSALGDELAEDLDSVGHSTLPVSVVHGDFTNHNVIAAGVPTRPVGVIDFGLAHVETTVADLGYGLWRSARPSQNAAVIDVHRAAGFVRGYTDVRPLTADVVAMIPMYIFGRGLQMLAKRLQRGAIDGAPVEEIRWLRLERHHLADELIEGIPSF